jgi:hypothetical protein
VLAAGLGMSLLIKETRCRLLCDENRGVG